MTRRNNNSFDAEDDLTRGFRLAEWAIDPLTNTFKRNGHTLHVEPKVMDVLLYLARHAGKVVSRTDLIEEVWSGLVVTDEVLTRCISELRNSLGDTSRERQYIRTIPKRGYSLMMPVTPFGDEPGDTAEKAVDDAVPPPDSGTKTQTVPISGGDGEYAASTGGATPWLVREILNLVKSSVHALARAGKVSLAIIAGGFTLIVAVIVISDPEVTVSHDIADNVAVPPSVHAPPQIPALANNSDRVDSGSRTEPASSVIPLSATDLEAKDEALTVAVLPFVNLSGDPNSDYFSNGLAEDIRNTLISTPALGIRVVARTSSEAFKNQAIDIREIAAQLNTQALVEGTVRISGERVRVTVQVTNADDGFPVWAESFEYPLEDTLRIQTEIAEKVVTQLAPRFAPGKSGGQEQVSVKAYDYYLLGRHHWDLRTAESLKKAAGYFREALRVDDKFALAYSGLADAVLLAAEYGEADRKQAIAQATELAEKALALNPNLAEAHASRGLIYRVGGDFEAAKSEYQRSVDLNPNYSMAHMWLGNVLHDLSDVNNAFRHYKVALQLDPLHPAIQQNYISALYSMGRYDDATRLADQYYVLSKSEGLLKVRLHALLAAGQYDQVLKFAVRHNFSEEYAIYATQAVIEALIYLQNYEDADALIEQNRPQFSVNQLAWFRAQQAIAVRDADKLLIAAETMEANKTADDYHKECRGNYINHWRGLAYGMKKDHARANTYFNKSIVENNDNCMRDPVAMAILHATYAKSLSLSGQDKLAKSTLQAARKKLDFAVDNGRGGVDVILSEAGLLVAAGKNTEATATLQSLKEKNWPFYGQLKQMPLFDGLEKKLEATDRAMETEFATMQQNCKDLRLTKFGV